MKEIIIIYITKDKVLEKARRLKAGKDLQACTQYLKGSTCRGSGAIAGSVSKINKLEEGPRREEDK